MLRPHHVRRMCGARRCSTFASLGITNGEILGGLQGVGVERPSEIQTLAIPPILDKSHTVVSAETGSGKTLSYLLPVLQRLVGAPTPTPHTVVMVPTQELVLQVASVAAAVCPSVPTKVAHGRVGPTRHDECSLLITTPVALRDNVRSRALDDVRCVVLDEADLLLSGSLKGDVVDYALKAFQGRTGNRRVQAVFAAATLPGRGPKSVSAFIDDNYPGATVVATQGVHHPVANLRQTFLLGDTVSDDMGGEAPGDDKWRQGALVEALLSPADGVWGAEPRAPCDGVVVARRQGGRGSYASSLRPEEVGTVPPTLVFAASVAEAKSVAGFLRHAAPGLKVGALHKQQRTEARKATLAKFMAGETRVVVCTDVAARGLDTCGADHVIQYSMASDAMSYLHRIGRTARMGRRGRVTTLVGTPSPLAARVVACLAAGEDLEAVFSRKRSLRRGIKKEEAAAAEAELIAAVLAKDNQTQ